MDIRNEKGFTLLEVLITIAVMAIVFIALAGAFNTIHQINARANTLTVATQLAQQQHEKVRNTAYNSIAIGTSDFSSVLTPYKNLGSPKSATMVVTQVNANGLKKIDITILYTDQKNPKTVKVTTLVALNGINK